MYVRTFYAMNFSNMILFFFSQICNEISFKSWLPLSDNVILNRGGSHSYSTQRDKNLARLTGYAANSRRFDDRNSESSATLANEVVSRSFKLFLMVLILCFCFDTCNWKFHLSICFYFFLYFFIYFCRESSLGFQNKFPHWMIEWMNLQIILKSSISS